MLYAGADSGSGVITGAGVSIGSGIFLAQPQVSNNNEMPIVIATTDLPFSLYDVALDIN